MSRTDSELFQARMQAVLQEAQFIRQEILDNVSREFKLHTATVTVYGAIIAFAFLQREPQVLLIAPIVAWAYTVLWITYKRHLDASSYYLQEMERVKWVDLLGKRAALNGCALPLKKNEYQKYWVAWQHFHDRKDMRPSIPMRFVIAVAICILGAACSFIGILVEPNKANLDLRLYLGILDLSLLVWAFLIIIIHVTRETSDIKRAIG